jgi:hypothetical protein
MPRLARESEPPATAATTTLSYATAAAQVRAFSGRRPQPNLGCKGIFTTEYTEVTEGKKA